MRLRFEWEKTRPLARVPPSHLEIRAAEVRTQYERRLAGLQEIAQLLRGARDARAERLASNTGAVADHTVAFADGSLVLNYSPSPQGRSDERMSAFDEQLGAIEERIADLTSLLRIAE